MKTIALSITLCLFSFLISAQSIKYRNYINRDTLQKHVQFLASDSLKGRDTGSEGQLIAADYISKAFIRYRLQGINTQHPFSPYYQDIELNYIQFPKVALYTESDTVNYKYQVTASDEGWTKNIKYQFIGEGLQRPDRLEEGVNTFMMKYDEDIPLEYVLQSIKGNSIIRQVIILMTENNEDYRTFQRARFNQMDYVRNSYYNGPREHPLLSLLQNNPDTTMHFMFISKNGIERFTGQKRSHWNKLAKAIYRHGFADLSAEELCGDLHVNVTGYPEHIQMDAPNVIGLLPGIDTSKTIIVGGHYDHLGHRNGEIYNGADDNASGTAGVMELARIFSMAKENGDTPPCNILFMAYTGEEKGLLGSKYYTKNPLIPLKQTIGMFNMDMIGRQEWTKKSDGEQYVFMLRRRDGRDMKRMVKELDKTDNYDLRVLHGHGFRGLFWIIGSDHYWFMRNDIPVAIFFTSSHDDYHQPTDTEEKITYDSMTEIVKLVYDAMSEWGAE